MLSGPSIIALPNIDPDQQLSAQDNTQLALIQSDSTQGGFWWNTIQQALQHLFKSTKDVFIPAPNSFSGETASLPLGALKEQGFKYVAFSWNFDNEHQVGVWININKDVYSINIYNSDARQLPTLQLKKLKGHIGDYEHHIQYQESPYQPQADDWSCGVFVVMHLLHAYAEQTIPAKKEVLPVLLLAPRIYLASKLEEVEETEQHKKIAKHIRIKIALKDELKNLQTPALANLSKFMQLEICAALEVSQLDHEHLYNRPLVQTLTDFSNKYPADDMGKNILRALSWFASANHEYDESWLKALVSTFAQIKCVTAFSVGALEESVLSCKDAYFQYVKTEIELLGLPDDFNAKENYYGNLLNILCSPKNPREVLADILTATGAKVEEIDIPGEFSDDDVYQIIGHLLILVIKNLYDLQVNRKQLQADLTREQIARENERRVQQEKRLCGLNNILTELELTASDEVIKLDIASNPTLFYLLKRYGRRKYFEKCSEENKITYLKALGHLKDPKEADLLALYPGTEPEFYELFEEYVCNKVTYEEHLSNKVSFMSVFSRMAHNEQKFIFLKTFIKILYQEEMFWSVLSGLSVTDRFEAFEFLLEQIVTHFNHLSKSTVMTILKLMPPEKIVQAVKMISRQSSHQMEANELISLLNGIAGEASRVQIAVGLMDCPAFLLIFTSELMNIIKLFPKDKRGEFCSQYYRKFYQNETDRYDKYYQEIILGLEGEDCDDFICETVDLIKSEELFLFCLSRFSNKEKQLKCQAELGVIASTALREAGVSLMGLFAADNREMRDYTIDRLFEKDNLLGKR